MCFYMSISKFVRGVILAFLCGVVVASVVYSWVWVVVTIVFVFLLFFLKRWVWICFLSFFLVGLLRLAVSLPDLGVSDVGYYANTGGKVVLSGQICAEVDVRSDKQYFVICAKSIEFGEQVMPVEGKVLVKSRKYPLYEYGDRVICSGGLDKPAVFAEFDYAAFLGKDDIYAVMYNPSVKVTDHDYLGNGLGPAFLLKGFIREKVERLFSEPSASLVLGLLLGVRSSIPQNVLDNFQTTGLTHILAISGYNITLIITIFALILKGGGRKLQFIITVAGIILFAILTGMSASVIRASVMGVIMVFALRVGRKSNGLQSLLLSVFLMVMVNPKILMMDISFQLSFMSTLGLLILLPLVEDWSKKLPAIVGEGLVVTLSATFFTLPITLLNFHAFSIISPLANVLFLPLIPLIMFSSFLSIIFDLVVPGLGQILGAVTWLGSFLLIEGVGFMAKIPFALMDVGGFGWIMFIFYYFALGMLITFFRKAKLRKIYCREM